MRNSKPVRSRVAVIVTVCAILAAGVTTVWAATRSESKLGAPVVRITPVATPVELNPCASGACW